MSRETAIDDVLAHLQRQIVEAEAAAYVDCDRCGNDPEFVSHRMRRLRLELEHPRAMRDWMIREKAQTIMFRMDDHILSQMLAPK